MELQIILSQISFTSRIAVIVVAANNIIRTTDTRTTGKIVFQRFATGHSWKDWATMTKISSLCAFCGSKTGDDPAHTEAARRLGAIMAERGVRLIYGGGRIGLMGVVAEAVHQDGGTGGVAVLFGGKKRHQVSQFLGASQSAHGDCIGMSLEQVLYIRP